MTHEQRGWFSQTVTTLAGLAVVGFVGIDVYQAGGIETWTKWRVAGYGLFLFAGLWLCHPHSGRWLAEQLIKHLPGGD